MDIAAIVGFVSGTILIIVAIVMGGSFTIFVNAPSLLIVAGGTIATVLIKFKMAEMVGFTRIAKKKGPIALEKKPPSKAFAPRPCVIYRTGMTRE